MMPNYYVLMTHSYKGFGALILSALIFSIYGFFIRELSRMFGDNAQVAARSFFIFLFLAAIIAIKRINLKIPKEKVPLVVLFGTIFPIGLIFFTISVNSIKAANSVFMLYAGIIFASLILGKLFFAEKLDVGKILAVIITVIGLLIFIFPFDPAFLSWGLVWGLLAGICDASTNALRKKLAGVNRQALLFYQFAISSLLAIAIALFSGEQIYRGFDLNSFIILILFALLHLALGNLLLYGFAHFDVNVGGVVLATELFFALIFNYFLLQEVPTPAEMIGGALIFLAACMTVVDLKKIFGDRQNKK